MEKRYAYTWEESDSGKDSTALFQEMLDDPELQNVDSIVVGSWGEAWDEDCQNIVDGIVENKERFQNVTSLFLGDMDYEECEVSWIVQADYGKLWAAMPQLKELTIKGSSELRLGEIVHENLESLTIICGGLPTSVIESIQRAKLPSLKKLLLYIGVDNYGFDGDAGTLRTLLEEADFPNLTYLGLVDSEIQDEVAELILDSPFMERLEVVDLSLGTLTDKGAALLLERLPQYPKLRKLDVHHHYLSDETAKKLEELPIETDVSDPQEAEKWKGEVWMYPMLTE